jgi:Spy/CpxP family protein refolding chaperone
MNKLLSLSALMLSSVLLTQAPAAIAAEGHWGQGCPVEKITHQLHLTAEQKPKVHAIVTETRQKMEPVHQQMKALHEKMKQAFIAGDEMKQSALAREKKDLIDTLMDIREQEREALSKVLTEAQRAHMVKLLDAWKHKHSK